MNKLLLVRHGKAEPHDARADFDRRLTGEGIEELNRMAPALAVALDGEIVIITSPLVRARETADILQRALHCPLEEESWVADGIFSRVAETRNRPEDIVILVGHNPTFDDWHRRLTGRDAHFKKGAAALYTWTDGEPPATCEWMKTAKALAKEEAGDEA